MTTHVFEKISIKRTKHYVDSSGKKRRKTVEFYQTLNPFNKNKDGSLKTREDIMEAITAEAETWLKKKEV